MLVPNPIPRYLTPSLLLFFSTTLQPLCYVVTFPADNPAYTLHSVLKASFFPPSPNSISPAPALVPSPAPSPAPATTPAPNNNVSSLFVPSPAPISTQNLSSAQTSSSPIVLSPSLLSLRDLYSTAIYSVASQECRLPGLCSSEHNI